MYFAKNLGKNIGENISKSLNSLKVLDLAKQLATYPFNISSKRVIQKTAEARGDLSGNEIADKSTRASKTSPKIIQKQIKKEYLDKDTYHQN